MSLRHTNTYSGDKVTTFFPFDKTNPLINVHTKNVARIYLSIFIVN